MGRYEVRRDGNVYNQKGEKISAKPNGSGYLRVVLYIDGQRTVCFLHHLVASEFLGPKPVNAQVRFKDGDKSNTNPSNLFYWKN